jgi:hypothetical protein
MVDGIFSIKDTYVVCKYVKKTLLELGFMGFRHLPRREFSRRRGQAPSHNPAGPRLTLPRGPPTPTPIPTPPPMPPPTPTPTPTPTPPPISMSTPMSMSMFMSMSSGRVGGVWDVWGAASAQSRAPQSSRLLSLYSVTIIGVVS